MVNKNTLITDMTVGEFSELVRLLVREELKQEQQTHNPASAYGLKGLADIFGVSITQAKRIKASGEIDRAITQRGRTIITDTALALKLWSQGAHGRRN